MAAALVALAAGWLLVNGNVLAATAVVVVPAVAFWAAVEPRRSMLAFLVALPLLFYGASVGSLSLFLGLPIAVFISLTLLAHLREVAVVERPQLPATAFVVLVSVASVSALLSERMVPAGSRVVYILAFGLFAWALARSIAAGVLTRRSVIEAIVAGAALAALVLVGQFLAQFVIDRELLLDHMRDLHARFAGERAAETSLTNWVVPDPPLLGDKLVRGAFPFVVVPSAGQYLMISLLGAIWLALRAPMRMSRAARSATWAVVALLAAALVATYSKQSWVGAVVGLVLMLGWHRRAVVMLFGAGATALAALVPLPGSGRTALGYLLQGGETGAGEQESYAERLTLLQEVPSQLLVSPIVGVGPGQYSLLSPGPEQVYYAHNLLIDSAVELGIIGAAVLLFLFARALVTSTRISPGLGLPLLAAYLTANVFDDTFYFPKNGFLLAAIFALACTRAPGAEDEGLRRPGLARRRPRQPVRDDARADSSVGG